MEQVITGKMVWFDIPVKNFTQSKSFFTALFGWDYEKMTASEEMEYWMVLGEEGPVGGMFESPDTANNIPLVGGAILYFAVDDVEISLAKAKDLGAEIVQKRTIIPMENGGSYAVFRDVNGNLIGMWAAQ